MNSFWSQFELFKRCLFSPHLDCFYRNGVKEMYQKFLLEKISDQVISTICYCIKMGKYITPAVTLSLLCRKSNSVTMDSISTTLNFMMSIGLIFVISYAMRSLSRSRNSQYLEFLKMLEVVPKKQARIPRSIKNRMMDYDFGFEAWPVEYSCKNKKPNGYNAKLNLPSRLRDKILSFPIHLLAYCCIHSFGITIIYPGSMSLVYCILEQNLQSGRRFLADTYGGERFKIETKEGNALDAMLIDKRNKHVNGKYLVVCSEGNSGFYEIGIMSTPIEAGYSVLGWNHPGFGYSTGTPYPDQEENAINAIMQFAMVSLGFEEKHIILYGWSIGGYTISWAAMTFPNTRAVILDASFDDLEPLATKLMPTIIGPIVKVAIKSYVNLNVSEQLCCYPGPISLIRRTEDEVICTTQNDITTNRGNDLLCKLLKYRYPLIFGERQLKTLKDFFKFTDVSISSIYSKYDIDGELFEDMFNSYVEEYSISYPMMVGENIDEDLKTKLAIFLATKYITDLKSTHCTPLPVDYFKIPKYYYWRTL